MNTDKRRLKTKFLPRANQRPSAFIGGQKSFLGAIEGAFPNNFRHFDSKILVPFRAALLLRDEVARVAPPLGERLLIVPSDDGEAFAVGGLERFEIDEAGHVLRGREHLAGHLRVIVTGVGSEPGEEQNDNHVSILTRVDNFKSTTSRWVYLIRWLRSDIKS